MMSVEENVAAVTPPLEEAVTNEEEANHSNHATPQSVIANTSNEHNHVPSSPSNKGLKRKLDNSVTSNVSIKNRFKHSRPMIPSTAPVISETKKTSAGLNSIAENYASCNTPSSSPTSKSNVPDNNLLHANSSNGSTTLKVVPPVPQPNAQLSTSVITAATTTAASSSSNRVTFTPQCCPFCQSKDTKIVDNSMLKCFSCHRQYMHCYQTTASIISPNVFYNQSKTTNNPIVNGSIKSRPVKPSGSRAKKSAEMIDLISSDEDENNSRTERENITPISTSQVTVSSCVNETTTTVASTAPTTSTSTTTPRPNTRSSVDDTKNSPSTYPFKKTTSEFSIKCNKAMFGELYGHALVPVRVVNNRIYLSLECTIFRDDTTVAEKYTLSVGQNDVRQIYIYFGRSPSIMAIETADRFAEVACRRIGRTVLLPTSADVKKRHIILALESAFKNEKDAVRDLQSLLTYITSWAAVKIMSLSEAMMLVQQADLDVCQQEFNYKGERSTPVETRLIYPFPPSTGSIPVTNEDECCLEEGTYLNDIIIDFYLKYLYEEILTEEQRKVTYIFNSYFYKRLTQKQNNKSTPSQMHMQVKKWTRNVELFEYDFVVIPVNENCHWYLVVVCFANNVVDSPNLEDEKDEEEEDDDSSEFVKSENFQSVVVSSANVTAAHEVKVPVPVITESSSASLPSTTSSSENKPQASSTDDVLRAYIIPANPNASDTSDYLNTPHFSPEQTVANDAKISNELPKQAYEKESFQRPCILIFDSLVGSGHSRVFRNIRHYLTQEWIHRKKTLPPRVFDKKNMKGSYPKVPRQNNDCDCGVFLLQYVEFFFRKPIVNYRLPIHLEGWFSLEDVAKKRQNIQELIARLAKQYADTKR